MPANNMSSRIVSSCFSFPSCIYLEYINISTKKQIFCKQTEVTVNRKKI